MENIKDDRGYNQVWADSVSTRIRASRRCDLLISQMNATSGKSLMEIGCGTGSNTFALAQKTGMKVLGTDLCRPFIEEARRKFQLPDLRFEVLDFNRASDFKGEKFDYIIGNGILHHLYHGLDYALVNMRALLKKQGEIIFLEPNIYNPYIYLIFTFPLLREKARLEPDEMAFSRHFITGKLQKAGFKNIMVEYKDFLLPGIPEFLVRPSIVAGNVLEQIPVIKMMSQSLFIVAQ